MPRMLDLIRTSQVPPNLMQSAARGSLSVPPMEMIEILVHLALHNKIFGQQARLTLAGWDEKVCLAAAQNPETSAEVLGYWVSPENLRIPLLRVLVENPSITNESLQDLATHRARPVIEVLLPSSRFKNSPELLRALRSNPNLRPAEIAEIEKKLGISSPAVAASASPAPEAKQHDEAAEVALSQYLSDNAAELEAVKDKPFQAMSEVGGAPSPVESSEKTLDTDAKPVEPATAAPAASHPAAIAHAVAAAHAKKHAPEADRRESTVQQIAKLDVKGRIALAVRGDKEARSILIRDMTKVVCLAVLDSPKLTDAEVEGFAQQKNVLDWVLRTIPMKRRFAKNYIIQRNLASNPRTPTDAALGLLKNLLAQDLKNLTENKEVADPVRKLALRLYKQKMERQQRT